MAKLKKDPIKTEKTGEELLKEEAIQSPAKTVIKKFKNNRLGMIGLIGFIAIILMVFIGSKFVPFDAYYEQPVLKNVAPGKGYLKVPAELKSEGIKQISSGITFSVGVSEEGNLYMWGQDYEGVMDIPNSVKEQLSGKKIDQVAAAPNFIVAATEDGDIIGWGNNEFGQTRWPGGKADKTIKKEGIKKIVVGDQYTALLTKEGNLITWGAVRPSKLHVIPKEIQGHIEDIEASILNIIVRTDDNKVHILGSKSGEIFTNLPKELSQGEVEIVDFDITSKSGAAVDSTGKLWQWGSRLENLDKIPEMDGKVVQVSAGREHMIALTENGTVYGWGNDAYGEAEGIEGKYERVYSGYFQNYAISEDGNVKGWGLDGFRFGTDQRGRDMYERLIHGGKMTLFIALIAVTIQIVLGVTIGMISGFYGGIVDNLLMRFAEIIASFPFYPLIITISAALPPNTPQKTRMMIIMALLGLLGWTGIARLVRAQILSEREKDYIMAAKALGLKEKKIIMNHILPNILSIVIVQATLGYAGNLLTEAGLSFLGFGVVEPNASWGNMMTAAQSSTVVQYYWWRWLIPSLAIFLTALTVNLMGDALRDALDPKSQER